MSCAETFANYALRAIGHGERLLPRADITLCEQVVLIGSGLLWNVYFAVFALSLGFATATLLALGKASRNPLFRVPSSAFVTLFRGTPFFLQCFFVYELFVLLPKVGWEPFAGVAIETRWLTQAWLGGLIVLWFNTAAYSAEIFYGALKAVPRGDIEAAKAIGMPPGKRFRRIPWPTMLRLAWPAYTNEAIFLFHSTALVFFAAFPARQQRGDALYYASYFAEKTFNPFVVYPVAAAFFIGGTLVIIALFGRIGARLNRHLAPSARPRFRFRPQYVR